MKSHFHQAELVCRSGYGSVHLCTHTARTARRKLSLDCLRTGMGKGGEEEEEEEDEEEDEVEEEEEEMENRDE
ncbi:hypothetical protein E2C01_021091 [Portunus trituberculatus]|uniref:Uncharacterized protein n=1 Tax=Portunus trituberculatus TaxID=210409 RepID=A0A5B7E1K4_PORTR|nr:hypothetical protein [Portunus trituberculatus]